MGSTKIIGKNMSGLNEPKETEHVFTTAAKVFGNPSLLKEILAYLVFNFDKKTSNMMVQTCRLVNQSWLGTTTSLLQKSVRPVIVLKLDENNSLDVSENVRKNGKRLDQFVTRFGSTNRLVNSFIPFELNLTLGYFRMENQKSLTNCLTNLGKELIQLKMIFPVDGGSMPFTLPRFNLPFLRTFVFQFSHLEYEKRDHDSPSFGNNQNSLWLIQLILNASEDLKEFVLPWNKISGEIVPTNFESLKLPSTILSLELHVPLKCNQLKILLTNQMLNLKTLTLKLPKLLHVDNDILFEILDRFRKTLTRFSINRESWNGHTSHTTGYLRLPIMETLKYLYITSTGFQVDSQNLEIFLPKLKQVKLAQQTKALLENWIQHSKFENVAWLVVGLVNDQPTQGNNFQSINLEMMDRVHTAFPNVTRLVVSYSSRDMSSLKFIFKNMRQLRSLTIMLILESYTSRHLLDSALLGIPIKLVEVLSEYSAFVHSVGINCNKEESIHNLSELVALCMYNSVILPLGGADGLESTGTLNLSDLLFTGGFFKMKKLKLIKLHGNIQVSSKMVELWNNRGCFIQDRSELAHIEDL